MDIGGLSSRLRFFLKVGRCRVIWIPDVISRAGIRLLVVCGKHIDGRGVGCRARLSLHIPSASGGLENLFNHIRIFNESNDPHRTGTLWGTGKMD
ncbi:hypothetical protein ACFL0M_13660 [Thermodesulfobacteriota bacterium]